ncbi:peptidoglycan-associated lipoprotein Pal [Dongia deserti]|uniref:peptidoglycan-associated lipoprotein Pal n=1 Tax=Dongia deserti TaxID=2268030 RepID=UPI000E65073D|nr:peptidoglycan-associated lipoprotein Pal [Dongia deserti]
MTIASAALLSLALLAGCQSKTGNQGTESADTDLANANGPGTATSDPVPSDLSKQLIRVGDRVHFSLDRYDLAPQAEATLQQQATLLQQHPQVAVTIQGHADERGTREYNLALGERRADTVRNYLIALGIPAERISVISFGKERPECAEAADPCWAQNRRGVTVVNQ